METNTSKATTPDPKVSDVGATLADDGIKELLRKFGAAAEQFANTMEGVQDLLATNIVAKRADARWARLRRLFIGTIVLVVAVFYTVFYSRAFGWQTDPLTKSTALISVNGAIAPGLEASADKLVPIIRRACAATHVSEVVLEINSPGGSPSESERVISAIEACRKGTDDQPAKPVYSVINGVGASAAYMIAMHTDKVFAGRYSIVGSIGAIMRFNDLSGLAERVGVKEVTWRSAPLKGGPGMFSAPTEGDAQLYTGIVVDMAKTFLEEVKSARKGLITLPDDELGSGKIWTAADAKRFGLIDDVAVLEDLQQTLLKDRKLHRYETKESLAESIGLRAMVAQVLADFAAPQVQ